MQAPFNLIALIFFRPLRLFVSGDTLRHGRIVLLRATHAPIVGLIQLYEWIMSKINSGHASSFRGPPQGASKPAVVPPTAGQDGRPHPGPRPHLHSVRQNSSETTNKSRRRDAMEDDVANAPTDVEVRLTELSAKIDRLAALVVALQPTESISMVRT
jgi:hypothetical protein